MSRLATLGELSHERLGDRFEEALSAYDTRRRMEVLVDDFLTDDMIRGKRILDAGCGLGYFSRRLARRGACVTACDIGPKLVEKAKRLAGCEGEVADVLTLTEHFGRESFDGVVSSECIEHTPDPAAAMRQMCAVVRPGGFLSLSTPNLLWQPVVRTATALRLRPFDGHENFSTWRRLRRTASQGGMTIYRENGLHLFPFQFRLHGLSTWCDRRLQPLRGLMINCCLLAVKR